MLPIFPLILSVCIVALVIEVSLMRQRINRVALILSIINVLIWIYIVAVYNDYIKGVAYFDIYFYSFFGITLVAFLIYAFVILHDATTKGQHYTLLTSAIKNTKFNVYYTVDKMERIKDISDSVVEELGVEKIEILGKKLFDVFDKTIRFTKVNGSDVNNRSLREYYDGYRKSAMPKTQEKLEIQFQNCNGKSVVLNVVERPVFISRRYRGRIVIGEKKSNSSLMNVERELIEKNQALEGIRHKFIAALELTEESLFFYDLDEHYIWGNDCYIKSIGLPSNTLNIDDFYTFIHPDDLVKYSNVLEGLSEMNPKYTASYRFRVKDSYVWVKECGKRIFDDENSNVILGFSKLVETTKVTTPGMDDIDELALIKDLNALIANRRFFEVAIIRLTNIPEINEKYNRSVGTMMMNEYVSKLKQNFCSESSNVYRISGLDYVLTITDARKMDMFKKLLESDGNSMNLMMEYGSIREAIKVKIGIAKSQEDADEANNLLKCAKMALKIAASYDKNYCYYKDVK